jgi:hypothetical protein
MRDEKITNLENQLTIECIYQEKTCGEGLYVTGYS